MRYLGLDLGKKTLGLAISDRTGLIASFYKSIRYENEDKLISELKDIIKREKIDILVLGLPKNMDNSLGFAAERSLKFKNALEENFNLKVVLIDERLTTSEAEKFLLANDMSRKKRKNVIDSAAAMIILDTYLKMKGNN